MIPEQLTNLAKYATAAILLYAIAGEVVRSRRALRRAVIVAMLLGAIGWAALANGVYSDRLAGLAPWIAHVYARF